MADKVIYGNFGQPRPKKSPEVKHASNDASFSQLSSISIHLADEALTTLEPNLMIEAQLQFKMLEVELFIGRIADYRPTPRSIVLRRDVIKSRRLEQLSNSLMASAEEDWKKHPADFDALIAEIRSRTRKK